MEIKGKVHCLFEQSGTFKNEFIKLGIPAEDYDIQNNFNETNHVIDLFSEIEAAYSNIQNRTEQNRTEQNRTEQNRTEQNRRSTIFDSMSSDDLVLAFFPCIYFCDNNNFYFTDVAVNLNIRHKNDIYGRYKEIIKRSDDRQYFYKLLWKMVAISKINNIRLIIENPWNSNGLSFLQHNFIKPSIVDKNRMIRGDYLKKPTAYWFINCENTNGFSYQNDKQQKTIRKISGSSEGGICSEERSMISKDYARNWICDFVLGKQQEHLMQSELF